MTQKKVKGWPGVVHMQADGRELFIITKQINGRRYSVSTRAHTLPAALKQLERFEADPEGYRPEGVVERKGPTLTSKLSLEYVRWMEEVRENTPKHCKEMGNRLADWIEDLRGKDLRKVNLRDDIKPALDRRVGSRPHRIIALKGFYAWMRKEKHLLTSAEDPTLDLPVPQAQPEKNKRRKVVEWKRVQACAQKLTQRYRDCLVLLTATAWHVTELERFVRSDESELVRPFNRKPLAVLVVRHKGGELTRTPLNHVEHVEAAQRLRRSREVPRYLNKHVKKACLKAKVRPFTLGVMRHSVLTWAIEQGATPAQASEFAGHKDLRTTRRFYLDTATPTVSVPTNVLKLVR